jgi:serine/threonine protein kinase
MNSGPHVNLLQRIEPVRKAFEQQYRGSHAPDLLPYLIGWEGEAREELFRQLISVTINKQRESGSLPSIQELQSRYPEFADTIPTVYSAAGSVMETAVHLKDETQAEERATVWQPSDTPLLPIPSQLGRYRIIRTLGEGAMGAVYLAHDSELDRNVALKVPKFSSGDREELRARFYREARSAGTLHHRNICPVFDIGEIDGHLYITMAFINGCPLSDLIQPDKPFAPAEAANLVAKLAVGLAAAHEQGVVHRDLKPSNIMVDKLGEPIVMDFGLAQQDRTLETELTKAGSILGTPAYMSPEQVAGDTEKIGPPTDIYTLGVILFQLLTGRLPFQGDLMSLLYKIANEPPVMPSSLCGEVDPEIEAICTRMMAKSIEDRFASMNEVAAALNAYAHNTSTEPSFESGCSTQRDGETSARSKTLVWSLVGIAVAMLLLVVAGISYWTFSGLGLGPGQGPEQVAKQQPQSKQRNVPKPPSAIFPFDSVRGKELQHNCAKFLDVEEKWTNSLDMEFVLIPPGEFKMGSSDEEIEAAVAEAEQLNLGTNYIEYIQAEGPLRDEKIERAFYLATTEVNVAQFKEFVRETSYRTTAETNGLGGFGFVSRQQTEGVDWGNPEIDQTDQHPVVEITLADAEQFCHWLSQKEGIRYRLPTEVQWEYACRAGTYSSWSCGDEAETLKAFAWYAENSDYTTHPVGTKSPNAFGLYDVHGNVREWTARVPNSPETGILRGGAFLKPPLLLRSAQRIAFKAVTPYPYHGFRVLAEVQPEPK